VNNSERCQSGPLNPSSFLGNFGNNLAKNFNTPGGIVATTFGTFTELTNFMLAKAVPGSSLIVEAITFYRGGQAVTVSAIVSEWDDGLYFGVATGILFAFFPVNAVTLAGALVVPMVVEGLVDALEDPTSWEPEKCDIPPMQFPFLAGFPIDPLAIDLNGDGVHLIGVDRSKVYFDFEGDGFRERAGWVAPEDGLPVRDLDDAPVTIRHRSGYPKLPVFEGVKLI